MSELILRHNAWLLVCDGQKALLLQNMGDTVRPRLEARETLQQVNPASHEQSTAPPGRSFADGGRRAATEETDFHQQAAKRFLDRVVKNINRRVNKGEISHFGIIAPAGAMGTLRPLLSEKARAALVGELVRDYAGLPVQDIELSLTRLTLH